MNATAKIQIQFSEPETPLPVPVWQVTATASHLSSVTLVDAKPNSGHFMMGAGFNRRSAEREQFIARIRRALQKEGN